MTEKWKDIEGYEGLYQISNEGRVKSLARSWPNSKRKKPETILKPFRARKYLVVDLKSTTCYVHRLVALHFIANPNNLSEVNHEDGNTENNHASNLQWCDKNYNMNHAKRTGLIVGKSGSANPSAILTEKDIPIIRQRREAGETYSAIGNSYGVDQSTIYLIIKRKKWNHVA